MTSPGVEGTAPLAHWVTRLTWLLVLFSLLRFSCGMINCDPGFITCNRGDKCINMNYICDGDNDCGDRSDEAFCDEWRHTGCSTRGEAKCFRNGQSSCISMDAYCRKSKPPCTGSVDPKICQVLLKRYLQRLSEVVLPTTSTTEEPTTTITTTSPPPPAKNNLKKSQIRGELFLDTLEDTMSHPECPKLYTRVGDHCLSFFYIVKFGWGEAKAFCESIDGDLISFDDNVEEFFSLMKHLQTFGLTTDFWIGGRYLNETEGWTWLGGDVMSFGSPFWAVRHTNLCQQREEETGPGATTYWTNKTACYHYQQAPRPDTGDDCAAITFRHFYYISDEDCLSPKSPLCLSKQNASSLPPQGQ